MKSELALSLKLGDIDINNFNFKYKK